MGASINLMPYSVFMKLAITDSEPTNIIFHLTNHSVVYPRRVIKDVLVKVDKFIFLDDFGILEMEVNEDVFIILGQFFLSTCDLLVAVRLCRLTVRLGD